jgi:PBP1b-binding outer membrane lipoprotein LpoB
MKAVLLILLLAGCVNQPIPQVVKVPVPTACVSADQLPKPASAMADAELAKLGDWEFVIQLGVDRLEYRRYSTEASALLIACVKSTN